MNRVATFAIAMLFGTAAGAAEYMEKTPFQLSRAFSPGVITSGGTIVWVAGQTATQDNQGNNIANNFEAQVKQVFSQVDSVLKRAGGSLDNVVAMTVFIKESRYGDRFVEMRKDLFKNGNYPGSALITVTNFARPGIEIEIQAVGVIGDACSDRKSMLGRSQGEESAKQIAYTLATMPSGGAGVPGTMRGTASSSRVAPMVHAACTLRLPRCFPVRPTAARRSR